MVRPAPYRGARATLLVLGSLLVPLAAHATPAPRNYTSHHYLSLEARGSHAELLHAAGQLGVELVEQIGELEGWWLVRVGKDGAGALERREEDQGDALARVMRRWEEVQAQQRGTRRRSNDPPAVRLRSLAHLPPKQRVKRSFDARSPPPFFPREADTRELEYAQTQLSLRDPMFPEQWHLVNTDMPEYELNVTGLWGQGVDGRAVRVAIIDDGLDMHSDDLAANFFAEGSYDFNDHTELPEPRLSDDQHGTRCAGEIAAVANDVCGLGVAYRSQIAGVRILSGPISDADEAAALNYKYQENDIYSCSWGPPDDGQSMEAPEGLIIKAMVNGVQRGRDGKGSIFVFAAGNGGGMDDQCNFDGYTNSIFSITIGAMDRKGLHPYYSELCAAMLAVAPSSGSGDHIHTTDVGKDKCTAAHGGTSAAAPLAVGVIALALQVRPDLTWRDVQHLMVQNAVFFNPDDPDWEETATGRKFSYKYGYGRIDGGALVAAAQQWKLVKPQAWFDSPAVFLPDAAARTPTRRQEMDVPVEQTEGDEAPAQDEQPAPPPPPPPKGSFVTEDGVESSFEVTPGMLTDLNFESLEHVTVRVWITHDRRGDVEVELISPAGVTSVLARQRRFDNADTGFPGWKFMTMKHWGEDPVGTWKLRVRDTNNPDKVGYFESWSLQLWGEAIDADAAKPWTLPEDGQPDEEQTGSEHIATSTKQYAKPTAHLPSDHAAAPGETHKPGLSQPGPPGVDGSETDASDAESSGVLGNVGDVSDEGLFDSIFALTKSPAWIFGAAAVVSAIALSAAAFFIVRSRRRRQSLFQQLSGGNERGAYAQVGDDVQMGLLGRGRRKLMGGGGGDGTSKVLYDAFAEGESEDDEFDDDRHDSETAALKYHDDFLEDEGEEKAGGPSAAGYELDEEDEGTRTPTRRRLSGDSP